MKVLDILRYLREKILKIYIKIKFKKKEIITAFFLVAIFSLALFLRIYFSYSIVFSEPIKYSSDDGVYHMRLVENELLGGHFPHRIYFDPYTYFPNGTYIHFAPLYDQLLATIVWLAGFGHPTLELINKIAPFYPAIMGSLVVFLTYFIAKKIWGRKIAIFSAFLMGVSPPYLIRSLLGNTDHHVAEVFFSTLAMVFLFFLVEDIKPEKSDRLKEIIKNKKFWGLTLFTGFFFGLYFLTWTGALVFLFIIFAFFLLYYLTGYFFGDFHEWILLSGCFIFLIIFLMILPFFGYPDFLNGRIYNISHLISLIFGLLTLLFVAIFGYIFRKKNIKSYFFPLFLVIFAILVLAVLKVFSPFIFETIIEMIKSVNIGMTKNEFAREFVAEMTPLRVGGAFAAYSALFYISLVSLIIVFYKFIKERKPKYLLIFVWTLIIMIMVGIFPSVGQQRFSCYLSLNISLLAGFLIVRGFEFGWRALRKAQEFPKSSYLRFYFLTTSVLIIFNVIFFFIFPFPFNIDDFPYPKNLPWLMKEVILAAKSPIAVQDDWYDTFEWLKGNTPDPGLDYYAFYPEPGINKETGKINPYQYPEQSYGILAEWDMGHMITYYSHRIPVANPFQQGIGLKKDGRILELGEGVFFLETEEEKATQYLQELKTRYVIVGPLLADPNGSFKGYVKWIQGDLAGYAENQNPPSKYDEAMSTRLYFLDGSGATLKKKKDTKEIEFYIKPLDHFRLIYESKNNIFLPFKETYYPFSMVKVFEYVRGAKIIGWAKSGTEIIISTEVETNQGRKFTYQKEVKAKDNRFELIVPYSTFGRDARISGETQFEAFAKPYKLKLDGKELEIKVTEEDILQGKVIEIID